MRTLVVEDDSTSRKLLSALLAQYGPTEAVSDGEAAVAAFSAAIDRREFFDLVTLDIMMPKLDGQQTLVALRDLEATAGIMGLSASKIVMTTALGDARNVMEAFREQCDGYLVKPIDGTKLRSLLVEQALVPRPA